MLLIFLIPWLPGYLYDLFIYQLFHIQTPFLHHKVGQQFINLFLNWSLDVSDLI